LRGDPSNTAGFRGTDYTLGYLARGTSYTYRNIVFDTETDFNSTFVGGQKPPFPRRNVLRVNFAANFVLRRLESGKALILYLHAKPPSLRRATVGTLGAMSAEATKQRGRL